MALGLTRARLSPLSVRLSHRSPPRRTSSLSPPPSGPARCRRPPDPAQASASRTSPRRPPVLRQVPIPCRFADSSRRRTVLDVLRQPSDPRRPAELSADHRAALMPRRCGWAASARSAMTTSAVPARPRGRPGASPVGAARPRTPALSSSLVNTSRIPPALSAIPRAVPPSRLPTLWFTRMRPGGPARSAPRRPAAAPRLPALATAARTAARTVVRREQPG